MTGNHTFAVVLEHKYDEALNNLVIILRKKPQKTNKATEFIQNAFFLSMSTVFAYGDIRTISERYHDYQLSRTDTSWTFELVLSILTLYEL